MKCLCDRGFADQRKRQAEGNTKHALTAETLLLVRGKQIFLQAPFRPHIHRNGIGTKKNGDQDSEGEHPFG